MAGGAEGPPGSVSSEGGGWSSLRGISEGFRLTDPERVAPGSAGMTGLSDR